MGEVYGARDERLDVYVALKTLRGELARDEQALDAFRRELLVLRRVTHPNVCRVFDYGLHEESAFFTMECVEGESLGERLRRDRTGAAVGGGVGGGTRIGDCAS